MVYHKAEAMQDNKLKCIISSYKWLTDTFVIIIQCMKYSHLKICLKDVTGWCVWGQIFRDLLGLTLAFVGFSANRNTHKSFMTAQASLKA